ncbi:hypothetical protein [Caldiplasma sukawensis]
MEPKTFTVTNKFPIGKRNHFISFIVILVASICLFASLGVYIIAFKSTANQINLAGLLAIVVFVVVLALMFVIFTSFGFGKRGMLIESIYSTSGDAEYNKRLKEAAQEYISGKIDKNGFFKMVGKETSIEENILKSLDNIKSTK